MPFTPLTSYPNYGTSRATPPTAVPASIADGATWDSDLMPAGFGGVVVAAKVSHAGTLNVQRYADLAGAVPVGAVITQALTADTAAWAGASDGLPFLSYNVQIVNGAGAASIPAYVIILTGQPY